MKDAESPGKSTIILKSTNEDKSELHVSMKDYNTLKEQYQMLKIKYNKLFSERKKINGEKKELNMMLKEMMQNYDGIKASKEVTEKTFTQIKETVKLIQSQKENYYVQKEAYGNQQRKP